LKRFLPHVGLQSAWLAILLMAGGLMFALPPQALTQQAAAPRAEPTGPSADLSSRALEHEEERGENVYRHSALIKSAAKVLHLSVEVTARSFEVLNLAVILLAIGIPLFRFLPRYLRGRSEKVSRDLETARSETENANQRLKSVEDKMAHLDEEIARFRAEMEAQMQQDEARIKASLEEEGARIVASAEQEINAAAAHARRGLRRFAADLAVEQAARRIIVTPETDRALIAEFVSDAAKGGNV
jgi:F-type H+-transporting ATPase subunit b